MTETGLIEQRPEPVGSRMRALTIKSLMEDTNPDRVWIRAPLCPPEQAVDGPMRLFRVAANNPLTASDFLTYEEEGRRPNADICLRRALSSYPDRAGADRLRRRVPHFRKHHICDGMVPVGAGKFLHTPSGQERDHWSWWPAPGIARHSFFQVIP